MYVWPRRQVVWLNDNTAGSSYAIPYQSLGLFAVSRDTGSFPMPCIYCQVRVCLRVRRVCLAPATHQVAAPPSSPEAVTRKGHQKRGLCWMMPTSVRDPWHR